jgi:paraquat-inducible protein A
VAGVLFYIPANVYPMLVTQSFGREEHSTILGGVVELADQGAWAVAAIVFTASIAIPIGKFIAIALLAISVRRASFLSGHKMSHVYELVELIGRWSMIDIFVVAILSALVQLNFVASLHAGPAAVCFALSVAFTMLSARAFDSRLYWDQAGKSPGDSH